MSRRTPIALLKWRQGAEPRLITQITQPVSSMLPTCTRFAALNPLLWINLLSAGSALIFCVLAVSGIKPAQANLSGRKLSGSEQSQVTETAKLEMSSDRESLGTEQAALKVAIADQQPTAASKTASNSTNEQAFEPLTVTPDINSSANEDALVPPQSEEVASASTDLSTLTGDTSNLASGQLTLANENPSVTPTEHSTLQLAQIPTLLPVPPSPAPVSSGNSNSGQVPYAPPPVPGQGTLIPVGSDGYGYNATIGQVPYLPQLPGGYSVAPNGYSPVMAQPSYASPTIIVVPVPTPMGSGGFNGYNPTLGQPSYAPPTIIVVPVPTPMGSGGFNGYNPTVGQTPYYPQAPVPLAPNGYNPTIGQTPYYPQAPVPLAPNGYSPTIGQAPYYPQTVAPLPAPLPANSVGLNNYNPALGQSSYYPQAPAPLPTAPSLIPASSSPYTPGLQQSPYLPQSVPPLPAPLNPSLIAPTSYNPGLGQSYAPQGVPPLPAPLPASPGVPNSNDPALVQAPYYPQTPQVLPSTPNPNLIPPAATSATALGQAPTTETSPVFRRTTLTSPSVQLQGSYLTQGDQSAARARLSAFYPLNPRLQFGATIDLTSEDGAFSDSAGQGVNINELYLATAPFADLPNLRFVVGQLDLTSYFDRNSFAKDSLTHFFNPVFQTNPALAATGIGSRPGFLVNWTISDNIEAKAAAFSSSRSIGDFALDGFAGEIGVRYGNAIIRGTYSSGRDAGSDDGFDEIFAINRGDADNPEFGLRSGDREEAYGLNAEVFIPELNMGVFGRYGRYENRDINEGGNTYSLGVNVLDVFSKDDRLGLAYGRRLSNNDLREDEGEDVPDVLELFYDFRFLPNMRLGFTLQQRNGFSDTYAGFRLKTEFDVTPRGD